MISLPYPHKLDEARRKELGDRFDAIIKDFPELDDDTGIGTILQGCEEMAAAECERQTHPAVINCLESVVQCCSQARFDYYVSTK